MVSNLMPGYNDDYPDHPEGYVTEEAHLELEKAHFEALCLLERVWRAPLPDSIEDAIDEWMGFNVPVAHADERWEDAMKRERSARERV